MYSSEGKVFADQDVFPIDDIQVRAAGYGAEPTVTGRARVGIWIHVAKAESRSEIVLCGQPNVVNDEGRRALLTFLKEFKRVALRNGTWDPSLPGESAAATDATTAQDKGSSEAGEEGSVGTPTTPPAAPE